MIEASITKLAPNYPIISRIQSEEENIELKRHIDKWLAEWKDNPFGNFAAAAVNRYGRGECYYLGSSFDEAFLTKVFDRILNFSDQNS